MSAQSLGVRDLGHGYDEFGLSERWLRAALSAAWPMYRYWFRVHSEGTANIPSQGGAIIVSNHSGVLPFDGMMIGADVVRRVRRPLRPVTDHLVAGLPFIGVALQRIGAVGGSSENVRALLDAGELVLIFPEGVPGISKHRRDKYKLTRWRPGHAELALRHRVPVVPAAVIGAEEQMPFVRNSKRLGRLVGAPHFPLPLPPIPLPVKYRISYGEPIHFGDADPDDPDAVQDAAQQTQRAVEDLIRRGLSRRHSVYR